MRLPHFVASAAVALLVVSTHSYAEPRPAAPQVTMGADLKLLRFDWEPVAGATFYRLWIKPGGSRYIAVGKRIPASITHTEHAIAVHLQDWVRTRYVVTACNSGGCSHSAALNPRNLVLETIGYLKASNTDPFDFFGHDVVVSDDGRTLAVSAQHESSAATGVNGDQADNSSLYSGAVYIFRRSDAGWRQDAYLKSPRPGIQYFGIGEPMNQRAIALSGDGSIAAIAASWQNVAGVGAAGEVYVFRRAGGRWSLAATLRAPEPQFADFFGFSVDMSLDGSTIKVSSRLPAIIGGPHEGRTHIFDRSGGTWVHKATLAPFYAGDFCSKVRMSGDGRTLVANCFSPSGGGARAVTLKRVGDTWVHAADLALTAFTDDQPLALNSDATKMALRQARATFSVGVYRWENSRWVHESELRAPENQFPSSVFGQAITFSGNGKLLAIGDYQRAEAGVGVSSTPVIGIGYLGAVFLYARSGALASPWQLRSVVTIPTLGGDDLFGFTVALSGSGRTLAVGAHLEDSNARGVDGDPLNERAPDAGAAFLY